MPITVEPRDIDSIIQDLGKCTILTADTAAQIFNRYGLLTGSLQNKYITTAMTSKKNKLYDNTPKTTDDDSPSLMGYALAKNPPIKKIYRWDSNGVRTFKHIYEASKSDIYDELHRYDVEGPIPETAREVYSNVQMYKVSDLKKLAVDRGIKLKSTDKKADVIEALVIDENIDPRIEGMWARPYFELRNDCGIAGLNVGEKKHSKQELIDFLMSRAIPMTTAEDPNRLDTTRCKILLKWCESKGISSDPDTRNKETLTDLVLEHRDGTFWDEITAIERRETAKRDEKKRKKTNSSDY